MFYYVKHLSGKKRLRGVNRFIVKYNNDTNKSFIVNAERLYLALAGNVLA